MRLSSIPGIALAALLLFPGMAAAEAEPAQPTSALFYPNEVHLTVEERIAPEPVPGKGKGLRIVLPAAASPDTFSATVNQTPANSFFWLDRLADGADGEALDEAGSERQTLLDAIKALKVEIDDKNAAIKAGAARLALWEGMDPNDREFKPGDIVKLDDAFAERLTNLYAAASRGKRELEDLNKNLNDAQRKLQRLPVKRAPHVAVIPYDGPEDKAVSVTYSYVMPASSHTSYRLTAFPSREALTIEQDITLLQNSGKAWKEVDVYISTALRDTSVRPAPLAPWHITLGTPPSAATSAKEDRSMSRQRMRTQVQFQANESTAAMLEYDEALEWKRPVEEEKGTFRLWSLGKKTIAAGVGVTLPLAKDEYKAGYYYTLQPSVSRRGFLTASLSLDKALELPQGKARMFVDNVAVGEQTLSINGNKATLFFGTDAQVTAAMRDVKRSAGEKGILSKEQNVLWHWEITVRNTRGRAVDVLVQDPLPDEQDSAITLAVESKPKAEKGTTATQLGSVKVCQWKFTLQPNEVQVIDHKVEVSAPADKLLNAGRN